MTAREWWLGTAAWAPVNRLIAYDSGMTRPMLGIKVREAFPGSIQIIEADASRAIDYGFKYGGTPENIKSLIMSELFSEWSVKTSAESVASRPGCEL